jgi:hypothetical protein
VVQGKVDGTLPMQLFVVSPYDSWWPVFGEVLAKTLDAGWFRFNVKLRLLLWNGASYVESSDAFGVNKPTDGIMHHSGASDWNHGRPHGMFALTAGSSYSVQMVFDGSTGGTWQYYHGGGLTVGHTYIWSPGLIRR